MNCIVGVVYNCQLFHRRKSLDFKSETSIDFKSETSSLTRPSMHYSGKHLHTLTFQLKISKWITRYIMFAGIDIEQ